MHSQGHWSHVQSRYYYIWLCHHGNFSVSPKFSMASVERPLFIYFNIYHLGFMQIVACVLCDVSLISSHHFTFASVQFGAF